MITKNFRNICAMMLLSLGNNNYGTLPIVATNGTTYYAAMNYYSRFPYAVTTSFSTSATTAGIVLGTGTTPASVNDYAITAPITSGLTAAVSYVRGLDDDDNPYLEFTLVLTNNSADDIVVTEIAYNQSVNLTTTQKSTSQTNQVVCFDHTLLDKPVTVPVGGQNIILYRLTTIAPE